MLLEETDELREILENNMEIIFFIIAILDVVVSSKAPGIHRYRANNCSGLPCLLQRKVFHYQKATTQFFSRRQTLYRRVSN